MTILEAMQFAVQCHQTGRLAEAESMYRQVLAADPQHFDALQYLAILAHQAGRSDLAVELNRAAIAVDAGVPEIHCNLGTALREQGRLDESIVAYREALRLRPGFPEGHSNLGNALRDLGRLDEAAAEYRLAIALRPDFADPHSNLGNALRDLGRLDEAIASYHRALQLRPDFADAHSNLANALRDVGRLDDAIACYRRAIELNPRYVDAYSNLGASLSDRGEFDEAIACFRRAIELKPDFPMAYSNLGVALAEQGEVGEAIACYRRALELKPDFAEARSNLLLHLHCLPGTDPAALFEEHRRWEAIHALPVRGNAGAHSNDRNPGRRLRIGYVSPDFRSHSVGFFLDALLAAHDRAQVEIFCYSNVVLEDDYTRRLRGRADVWRSLSGVNDAQAAELIRGDAIDILVDLAGHTAGNRLPVFARRPAPVQVTCLGYCDTTGLSAIDWRLTDPLADPPGTTEHLYAERLARLPDTAWCFSPSEHAPPVAPLPALERGCVTFGCFNFRPKITAEVLELWARLLAQVPGSHLLLKNRGLSDPSVQQRVWSALEKAGIAPARVELSGRIPSLAAHLEFYHRMDVALDTFPYHGTTTTCEALWMGVPVVTLAGKTHVSRVGVSLLTNAGLPELIAGNREDYVRIAAGLAGDLPRLAALRSGLRERLAVSPLLDGPRYARNVEAAFRQMWREWCAGRPTAPHA